jgi:hypothetical protein
LKGAFMKIKMLTTKCGPISSENWVEGQKRTVCDDEGEYWIKQGIAVLIEKSVVKPAEKAVISVPERAVVKPTETAKGAVPLEAVKAPVAALVKPVTVASAKAATWGTPEVK